MFVRFHQLAVSDSPLVCIAPHLNFSNDGRENRSCREQYSRIPIQGPKGQYQPCLGGWSSLQLEKLSVLLTKKGRQCFSQWQITVISIVFTIGKGHGKVKKSSCVLSTELFWGIVFYIMCGILLCLGITVSGMYLHHMNLIL